MPQSAHNLAKCKGLPPSPLCRMLGLTRRRRQANAACLAYALSISTANLRLFRKLLGAFRKVVLTRNGDLFALQSRSVAAAPSWRPPGSLQAACKQKGRQIALPPLFVSEK